MAEAGRPTELTDEVTSRIRRGILMGKRNMDIQEELGISPSTWDTWFYKDYNGFRTSVEGWRRDRKLMKAERCIEEILDMGTHDKDTLKVVQDTAKFVAETLGKAHYSKRNEMSGPEGKDLLPTPIMYVQRDDSDSQDKEPQEKN